MPITALAIAETQRVSPDGIFETPEFLDEFAYRYQPGQHVILFGPPGRGKTTMAGKMLAATGMPKTRGLFTIAHGPRDPAIEHLGKIVKEWPPPPLMMEALMYDDRKAGRIFMRRYQFRPRKPEHFVIIRRKVARLLRWMFAREDWTLFLPDLQLIADPGMMGLGKEVDQLILTLRKCRSAVWMDAQAPRWIPRSCSDCTSHLLMWRNRDEDSVRRLAHIAGLNFKHILSLMQDMEYHDTLWIDNIDDEYYLVKGGPNRHGR